MPAIEKIISDRVVQLNYDQRMLVINQATILLSRFYAHLPQKEAGRAIRPLQQLRLLRSDVEKSREDCPHSDTAGKSESEKERDLLNHVEFHERMIEIFTGLKDRHTQYVAWRSKKIPSTRLDFNIRRFEAAPCSKCQTKIKRFRYVVTNLKKESYPSLKYFDDGVEITHWNGVNIETAIELNAQGYYGANQEALLARGLKQLTARPMANAKIPTEDFVTINFLKPDGEVWHAYEVTFAWEIFEKPSGSSDDSDKKTFDESELPQSYPYESLTPLSLKERCLPHLEVGKICNCNTESKLKSEDISINGNTHVYPAYLRLNQKIYLYIEIASFQDDRVVEDVMLSIRKADQYHADQETQIQGIILDIRGNEGGEIDVGDQLLQLFANSTEIERSRFQIRATPDTLKISRDFHKFLGWNKSLEAVARTGEVFSTSTEITPVEKMLGIAKQKNEQKLFSSFRKRTDLGKSDIAVVLIVDALTYSSADIFAAGFQDNNLGTVMGTDRTTGAGGARLMSHEYLLRFFPDHSERINSEIEFDKEVRGYAERRKWYRLGKEWPRWYYFAWNENQCYEIRQGDEKTIGPNYLAASKLSSKVIYRGKLKEESIKHFTFLAQGTAEDLSDDTLVDCINTFLPNLGKPLGQDTYITGDSNPPSAVSLCKGSIKARTEDSLGILITMSDEQEYWLLVLIEEKQIAIFEKTEKLAPRPNGLKPLPKDIDMQFSAYRTIRSGKNRGLPLEDIGVTIEPCNYVPLQKTDILSQNNGLPKVLLEEAIAKIDGLL